MNLKPYQTAANDYEKLSLKDLLDARELYHVHLMQHPNVVATALGMYRIRIKDNLKDKTRTMENSEVRRDSWPCVLAFVAEWVKEESFDGKTYDPDAMVPKTLYLPDGRRVPVCVILAPRELRTQIEAPKIRYPVNNIGGGFPVIARVQGRERVATIACLVSDGHKYYALTNRHVTGEAGEVIYSHLGGREIAIGITAPQRCERLPFDEIYEGWSGKNIYVNLDAGLIDIENLDRWTANIRGWKEPVGPLADFSVSNLSLSLVGCHVCGYGSASGIMRGEIQALFYRYKSQGGFEYIADFLIGPRSSQSSDKKIDHTSKFITHPGDSGTLWLLEPIHNSRDRAAAKSKSADSTDAPPLLPLALQWGAHVLDSPGDPKPQTYVLATCLSTICSQLNVDVVRDWNLDQPDTWGAVGHFSIASRTLAALSNSFPKLNKLMKNNLLIISHDDATILASDFKGMGSDDFVPMADVPDFFWKHGKQGHSRGMEGPNHFADMDQNSATFSGDLLTLCQQDTFIDSDQWNSFYDSVQDALLHQPIAQVHRGLLPFRVWQIFDEMMKFVKAGDAASFVCAAGVLAHYVGDACQPLHISRLHDGDPDQPVTHTVHHINGTSSDVVNAKGMGVHAAYEDDMVNAHRKEILDGLENTPAAKKTERVANGFEAAKATIQLMSDTFNRLPPASIVQEFLNFTGKKADRAEDFWQNFGQDTIQCMQDGTHLLAVLWESAWAAGDGDTNMNSTAALTQTNAMKTVAPPDFLPSCSIADIGAKLIKP